MKHLLLLCAVLALAGCATAKPEPVIQWKEVKVIVQVPCDEPVPARPRMPTEHIDSAPSLDAFVAAATAEIELRDGYEGQLVTALKACTAPINPKP